MTSMVKWVARAIWNIRREEEDRCDMELEDMGRTHSVWAEARAVLEEMREPTDAMVDALEAQLSLWVREEGSTADVFAAGIDAALNEQVSG